MFRLGLVSFFVAALLSYAREVAPGTVNYSEGEVTLHGQTLETGQGRAEVLLTPGVYLRVGEHSVIKMETAPAGQVKVELVRGETLAEVDQVDKGIVPHLMAKGANVRLDHSGLYLFGDGDLAVAVYHGKLRVEDDGRRIDLHRGQALSLDRAAFKPQKFDPAAPNALYTWSERRAGYASQVSEWTGESLLGLDGRQSYSDGWYWNPWYKSWAFVPKGGYILTPFGYGLYAPQTPHSMTPVFADFRN